MEIQPDMDPSVLAIVKERAEMELLFFVRGLAIGFSIAAPVGPIGVLCIRRTLAEGRASGFVSGLGAATADAFYGAIAGFGLTFISIFLTRQQEWFRIVGGIFLLYLGIRTLVANPSFKGPSLKEGSLIRDYASTLFLTLTNPITILVFAAIYAGLGIVSHDRDFLSAGLLVLGVFTGSTLWWFFLSYGVSLFRKKFDLRSLKWVNRTSGFILLGFGLLALLSLKRWAGFLSF